MRVMVTRDYAIIVNRDDLRQSAGYKAGKEAASELDRLIKAKAAKEPAARR